MDKNNVKIAKKLISIAKELLAEETVVADDSVVLFDFNAEQPQDGKTASVEKVATELMWMAPSKPSLGEDIKNVFLKFWNSLSGKSEQERREQSIRDTNNFIMTEGNKVIETLNKHIRRMATPRDYDVDKGGDGNGGWSFTITLKNNPLKCCKIGFNAMNVKVREENNKLVCDGLKKHSICVSLTLPTGRKDDTTHDEEWFDTPSECIAFVRDNFFEKDIAKVL